MSEHQAEIRAIYERHLLDVRPWTDPIDLYTRAGRAYAEILELNLSHGLTWSTQLDSVAIWYLAEWIKAEVRNRFVEVRTIAELAEGITAQILRYYRVLDARRRAESPSREASGGEGGTSVVDRLARLEDRFRRIRALQEAQEASLRALRASEHP